MAADTPNQLSDDAADVLTVARVYFINAPETCILTGLDGAGFALCRVNEVGHREIKSPVFTGKFSCF
jgi:hypothetical protein